MRRRSFLAVGAAAVSARRLGRGNSGADLYWKFSNSDTPVFPFRGGPNNDWGYIDETGRVLIAPERAQIKDRASDFFGGLCAVTFHNSTSWVIDTTGAKRFQVFPNYCDWNYVFQDGLIPMREREAGLWGYVDEFGKWMIKPQFDFAFPFAEQRGVVTVGEQRGIIATDGRWVVKPSLRFAMGYREGLVAVTRGENSILLDVDGRQRFPQSFDTISGFRNGVSAVERQKKWGLINRDGVLIVPCIYDSISAPEGSRPAPFVVRQGDLFGLMDAAGNIVLKPAASPFDYASSFSSGFALVREDMRYSYIGPDGSRMFGTSFLHAEPFVLDRAVVTQDAIRFSWINRLGKLVFSWKMPDDWNTLKEQRR